jgi:cystathionine beta-lyase/cystathionine gamma-synthase
MIAIRPMVSAGLLRMRIGCEDAPDIWADLEQAL